MSSKLKKALLILISIALTIGLSIFAWKKLDNSIIGKNIDKTGLDSETLKEIQYEEVTEEAGIVEEAPGVSFRAFFLKDLNNDGYVELINGTCKELGGQDTLYIELNVEGGGTLTNPVITINGENFYLQTKIPRDDEVKENAVGNNITRIVLNDIATGTNKILTGMVRSGDYSSTYTKNAAIHNNINNYSINSNTIVLSGTYEQAGEEPISFTKTQYLSVDWFGTASTYFYTTNLKYEDLPSRIDEANELIDLSFSIETIEGRKDLLPKANVVEGTIPLYRGYEPTIVSYNCNSNETFSYNPETHKFTIRRESVVDENGNVTSSIGQDNTYRIILKYPLEAYTDSGEEIVDLQIPVDEYYECFNNDNPAGDFDNPYIARAQSATIKIHYQEKKPNIYAHDLRVTVGTYYGSPYRTYVISKKKPIRLYNRISQEEINDDYNVAWNFIVGTNEIAKLITIKENEEYDSNTQNVDEFYRADPDTGNSRISMEDYIKNVGISFSGLSSVLKEDGILRVIDEETEEVLLEIDSFNKSRYEGSTFYYEMPVAHIRVEIENVNTRSNMIITNIKRIDDDKILENFTREKFNKLKRIYSQATLFLGEEKYVDRESSAVYDEPNSVATIDILKDVLSTQKTEEGDIITIQASFDPNVNQVGWVDGEFLIKLPKEIIKTKINSIEISNNNVEITSYELVEDDTNLIGDYIRIKTSNITKTPESFNITLDVDMTTDPRIATTTKNVELYASNKNADDYYYLGQDIYDVNSNLNTIEYVSLTTARLNLISPNSLLTTEMVLNFDDSGTLIVSPQVADVTPQYASVDNEESRATIGVQIKNNYAKSITDVIILGKIPFEGNTTVLRNRDLHSAYDSKMVSTIRVPEELQATAKVYYSTNENPNKDLTDTSNGWILAEDVENWDNIRTYLIDFGENEMVAGYEYIFYYDIEIPSDIDFNKISYGHHGVYFSLITDEGKYRTQIEPNPVGIRIAQKYNLDITKYILNNNTIPVPGASYTVVEVLEGDIYSEEVKSAITGADGKLEFKGLYGERVYEVKETISPKQYELNPEVTRFIGHVADDGTLTIEILSGSGLQNILVGKVEGVGYVVNAKTEDEVKAKVKVIKTQKDTDIRLSNTRFGFKAQGSDNESYYTTDTNGEFVIESVGLSTNFVLTETKAKTGYYLNEEPISFKIIRNGNEFEVEDFTGTVKNQSLTTENGIPILNLEIEDEKIPTYDIDILKVSKGEHVPLAGIKFNLYKDGKRVGAYETDVDGRFSITGLYQFEDRKNIDQTYVLKEVSTIDGYSKVRDIEFSTKMVDGVLVLTSESQAIVENTGTNTKVSLTIENPKTFELTKYDGETGELLPNTKFAIYNIDNGDGSKAVPAVDVKGRIVGTPIEIGGKEYYYVETDENGKITANLPSGMYKVVEIEASNIKYDISKKSLNTYYFGIGETRAGGRIDEEELSTVYQYDRTGVSAERAKAILVEDGVVTMYGNSAGSYIAKFDDNNEMVWERRVYTGGYSLLYDICLAEDGGIITAGDFDAGTTIPGSDTASGQPITISNSKGALIFKYNLDGKLEWYRNIWGGSDSYIHDLYIAEDTGDIFACGRNPGSSNFVNGITCTGTGNGFVVKYDKDGNPKFGTRVAAMTWGVVEKDGFIYSGGDSGLYKLSSNGTLIKTLAVSSIKSVTSCDSGILVTRGNNISIYDEELNQIYSRALETTANYACTDSFNNINIMLNNGKIIVLDGSDYSEIINKSVFSCATNIFEDELGKIIVSGSLSGKTSYAITGGGGNIPEQSEIIFNNYRKEYKITTDVDLYNGVKGGTISGEDLLPYETVKYGDSSIEPIVIQPNAGYKINYIKINGEEIFDYVIDGEGKVTLPQFDNVIENKHITVQFLQTSNTFKIKKVDEYTNEPIEGVSFKLDQLEERTEPNNEEIIGDMIEKTNTNVIPTEVEVSDPINPVGNLTPMNEIKYTSVNEETPIDGVLGGVETTQEYGFVDLDGALIPTNSKVYQTTIGGTAGIKNTIAESYIKVDLTGLEGYYALKVNAEVSSRGSYDYGYAAITRDTNFITYNNNYTDKFINISGTTSNNYYTNALKGGGIYYLHIGYRKSNNADYNNDLFRINSINVFPCVVPTEYNFIEEEGKYKSSNTGVHNSYSASYIPIDLTGYDSTDKFMLKVNYDISSQSNNDYGYMKVSEYSPSIQYTSNAWFNVSGNYSNQERTKELTGGKKYYLNIYYYKNGSTNTYDDKFTINSVKLYETESRAFNFEEVDGKYVSTNQGYDRTTSWSIIPIDLTEYSGKYNVKINADISSQASNDYGYVSYSTSTTSTGTNIIGISGNQTNYTQTGVLTGGRIWYLHLRYIKNDNTNQYDDKFTINSIEVSLNDSDLHHTTMTTNAIGEATCQIPYGLYRIEETGMPEGYEGIEPFEYRMNDESEKEITVTNRPFGEVIVHHYLKDNDGNYTTTRLADDVIIKGKVGTNYATEANLDIVDYDLERDAGGNYVIPSNASGQYAREVQEVNYYYETRTTKVIVHHYIEGSTLKVPLIDGTNAQDQELEGRPGEAYTTSSIANEDLSTDYELASVPELANGTYQTSDIEITYYYKKIVRKVTIQKVDEDGVTPLENVKFEIDGLKDRVDIGGAVNNGTYYMQRTGNKYVSNNKGVHNSTADTYFRIDMTNAAYNVIINANVQVSSQTSDYGYMYVTESPNTITLTQLNNSTGRLYRQGGSRSAENIAPYTLAPGKVYYLHIGYYKNASGSSYNDTFTVNSINYTIENKSQYTTNGEGKIKLDLNPGSYSIYEIETLQNYVMDSTVREITIDRSSTDQTITITNNKKRGTVVTNYYKEGTTEPIILADGTPAQSITTTGIVDEMYITNPANNVSERYDLVGIPENASGEYIDGEIVVNYYYHENMSNVKVHYYIEGTTTSLVPDVDIPGYVTQSYTTESSPDIPTYYHLVAEPSNKNGVITRDEIVVTYYYALNTYNYTTEYYYDGVIDNSKTYSRSATYGDSVSTYDDKNIPGYRFDHTNDLPIVIGEDESENVIRVYYVKDDFGYTVEYYYDGVIDNSKTENYTATFQDLIETYVDKNIPGYKFDHTDEFPLRITEVAANNVIKVYYVKDDFGYRVEYYYDGTIDNSKTENYTATFQDLIETYVDKNIPGYKLDHTDKFPLRITEVAENNVIKVYYEKDDFGYRVEYYYDGAIDNSKTENYTATFQDLIETYVDKNIPGYKFDHTDKFPLSITEVAENNVIKVYYVKDDFGYRVEYYYDGTIDNSKTENYTATFQDLIETYTDKNIPGYKFDHTDEFPLRITEVAENNVIKVYYVKDSFGYRVEYYYDETIDNSKTENYTATFQDLIETYEDKVIDGYRLDHTDKFPLSITEVAENNVIKVYYVKRTDLSYVVNYLEKGTNAVLSTQKTVPNQRFGDTITSTSEKIDIDGYYFDSPEKPEIVIKTDLAQNVINLYYTKRTDLKYTVYYFEKGTNKPIDTSKVVENQRYLDEIDTSIEIKPIYGYNYDSIDPTTLTIDYNEDNNIIRIYYTKKPTSVLVRYLEQGTDAPLSAKVTIPGLVFDHYETEEAIDIPDKYYLVSEPANKTGEMTEEQIVVTYYYSKKSSKIVVRYVDMVTNEELVPHDEITKVVDQTYETTPKDIADYKVSYDSGNTTGTVTVDPIEVIYYYAHDAYVYVHFVEKSTGNTLAPDETIKDVEGTPYKAESKVIRRYKLIESELPTNAEGTMTREPITVIYYYEFDTAFVEVHHKDNLYDGDLVPMTTIDGAVGDDYSTEPISIPNYDLVEEKLPDNASGQMTKEKITVNYYYAKISSVTVKYIDRNTGEELADPVFIPGHEGDEYHSTAVNIDDYILVSEPENKDGFMPYDPIEIIYYYAIESAGVIEKHIDEMSNELLYNELHPGNVGDEYNIESRNIENYAVDENLIPDNKHGYMTEEPIEVIYYYRYLTPITVEYIDRETGEKLIDDINTTGYEGENYVTEEKTFPDYKLVEIPTNKEGILTKDPVVVKYYYAHDSAGVIVHYIDEQTNKEIAEKVVIPGQEGDPYETIAKTIENYELNSEKYPTNNKGKMTKDLIEVYYYYTPKAQVIIEYIDKETGERIEEVIKDGYVGDEYHSNPKYFDLYQIIEEEIPENKDGVMKKETITVRYYYHKKAQVVVEHIDRHTNEVIETSYIYGYENDEYYTSSRDFENYSLIESELPTNREGTMTREHITYVKYYYERRGQVIVEYRDVNTNQLITTSDVINGKVGDNYTTKEKDIYGYKLVVDKYPDNSSGLFKDKTITVTYYYDRVYTDGDIVINNNNNNVVTIVSGPKFEEEITRVVIPDNTPQNRVVQKPITVVPTPSPVNNTVENNSSTIIYNVPNTEKNSHYQLAAIMMISLGWYIVVRNKQDEK